MTSLRRTTLNLAALAIAAAPMLAAAVKVIPVTGKNADEVLMPGDVMVKLIGEKSQASSWGIVVSEGAMQVMYGKFSKAVGSGNAGAVHAAVYVGNGETAEAHGEGHTPGHRDKEGVSLRKVEAHPGYIWLVFRPKDATLAAEAAQVARTWATGKMGYKLPLDVAFRNAWFGPNAAQEALGYGKGARSRGGPPGHGSMFCSQFIVAVYQAAVVARQLKRDPNLSSAEVRMVSGVDSHASITSPLRLHGQLRDSKGFTEIAPVVTQTYAASVPSARFVSLRGLGGKCFDAEWKEGRKVAGKGSPIHLWDCNGGENQKWKLHNGRLESAVSGQCLAVDEGRLESGRRLILWDCRGSGDQRWDHRNGMLVNDSHGSLCADVAGEKTGNGTRIILWKCGPHKANQQWSAK